VGCRGENKAVQDISPQRHKENHKVVEVRLEMRLTQEQTSSILAVVKQYAGENAVVYLFGSRLNEHARGGDVDLLIEAEEPISLLDRARIKMTLEKDLCLPVDIVAKSRCDKGTPFQTIARSHAVRLGVAH